MPPFAFKKNLEQFEADVAAGSWKIGGYVDLVSENRFLLYRLRSEDLSQLDPDIVVFRGETASALAPDRCPRILDVESKPRHLDFLTPHFALVDPGQLSEPGVRDLFKTVIEILIEFEKYCFFAPGLVLESIGRGADGGFYLMPNAFVLPFDVNTAPSGHSRKVATNHTSDGYDSFRPSLHLRALVDMMQPFLRAPRFSNGGRNRRARTGDDAGRTESDGRFRVTLAKATAGVGAGEIKSLGELFECLFDQPVAPERGSFFARDRGTDRKEPSPDAMEIAAKIGNGAMLEIAGGAASGKSEIIREVAALLEEDESCEVTWIDNWDLAALPRRKPAARDAILPSPVWLIDDIEEKTFLYSDLYERLFDREDGDDDTRRVNLVYTLNPSQVSDDLGGFLSAVKSQAGERFFSAPRLRSQTDDDSPLAGRLEECLNAVRRESKRASQATRSATDSAALASELLACLHPQERQILELTSVARFPLPQDIVLSVFADTGDGLHKRIHRLAGLDLIEIEYRRLPPSNRLSITLKTKSSSLNRLICDGLSQERRQNLHRTVARTAGNRGGVPTVFVFEHLIKGREPGLAARCGVEFLKETDREKRAPYLDRMIDELVDNGLQKELPFADQMFVFRELGADLAASGRHADAEKLLLEARSILDEADPEEHRKNATVVTETLSLLADIWATRGNYSRALSLLSHIKASLNPYHSLPAQARLQNDIGWLQYRLGNYDDALDSCKLSLTTLNFNEHALIVAQALNLMGVIHFNTSRYDDAISYYEQSAFLREREGDISALSASYNNLALAYQAKGEYDKALNHYNKSLDIKKLQNNEAGIAGVYLNQALLHLAIQNFEEAELKCRESLEISVKLDNTRLTTEIFSTLGDIEFTRGHFDEAEEYYQKSRDIAHSLETINEEMGAHRRLAKLYLAKKRYDEARSAVDKAARLGRQIGSRYESAQIETILGDLDREEGRAEEAIRCYETAASSYSAVSKFRLAASLLARVGLVHASKGNTFEAKQYLDRALDLAKSEIGHEIPHEIATLQQTLRERPVRTDPSGTESQKLLYAFYELSSLTDVADDRNAFFNKVITVFQDLTGSSDCYAALQTEENEFVVIDRDGEQEQLTDEGLRTVFHRALQQGRLLDSASGEIADVVVRVETPKRSPFVCVPMRAMGKNLGCLLVQVPAARLPLSKEDGNFFTSIGRHIAGDVRLMLHLEEHAHKEETLEKEFESLKAQVAGEYRFENLIGKDESMKKVFRTLEKVNDLDTGLLIIGESGTGKTELARAIHYNSPRRKRIFQQLHCAEIPVNLLESELFGHEKGAYTGAAQRKLGRCEVADGGTVFLDDVNVMPSETQTKLLHYLESKSFMRLGGTKKITTDVRIIASSNEDLEQLVKKGLFREDLYYRLKVLLIELPPLRERKEDMIAIALDFLKKRCQAQGKPLKTLSPETIKLFQKYRWPGNVRELQNILEQVVLLSDDDIITPSSLPEDFLKKATGSGKHPLQSLEALAQQMVESGSYSEANPLMPQLEALLASKMSQHVDGKNKAASLLGITKPTLYTRLRGYDKMH